MLIENIKIPLDRDVLAILEEAIGRNTREKREILSRIERGIENVETVAVLSRKSATKTFILVTVSPKDMGLDESKAQPTYENIRKYVKETHGLTVSTLNIAQMKAECGLEMECDRSGGKQQPKCPPEKRETTIAAIIHEWVQEHIEEVDE